MSASSHLFLLVALACLAMPANTLKCWQGVDQRGTKKRLQCEPRPASCTKFNCTAKSKDLPPQFTTVGCQYNSTPCERRYHEDEYSNCDVECCHDDFCNVMPDLFSGVIGLHTSFGIGCIVFAVLIAAIFSAEFVK